MQDKNHIITIEELEQLEKESYILVDMREKSAFEYGAIEGAIHIPENELIERLKTLKGDKRLILYCTRGIISEEAVWELEELGVVCAHLEGGHARWLLRKMEKEKAIESQICEEIEKGLQKKFKKSIFSRFAKAIREYELLKAGDKVAICISGGKDSMLMAKLFQELKRHRKFEFDMEFLVMDPGYNELNRSVIENNAEKMGIPITVFETDIFETVYDIEKSPCYLCARMRRGHLYSKAKELGCNKIALGHHYDDVIETILMGMMYGAQVQTMMPKLHSTNFEGMELIRPMYLVREDDIKRWRDYHNLQFIQCACRFTDTCTTCRDDGSNVSKRMEIKDLIKELKKINPFIESNIFKSVENVNLDTVIAYKKKGERHHFLDEYEK